MLEIYHAKQRSTPIVMVEMSSGGFDLDEAKSYIENLEENLPDESFTILSQQLGSVPILSLQDTVLGVLNEQGSSTLTFNSSGGDQALLAQLKD